MENKITIFDKIAYTNKEITNVNRPGVIDCFIKMFIRNSSIRQLCKLLSVDAVCFIQSRNTPSDYFHPDVSKDYEDIFSNSARICNSDTPDNSHLLNFNDDLCSVAIPIYINSQYEGCVVLGVFYIAGVKFYQNGGLKKITAIVPEILNYGVKIICDTSRQLLRRSFKFIVDASEKFSGNLYYMETAVRNGSFNDFIKDAYTNCFEYDLVNDRWKCSSAVDDILGIGPDYTRNYKNLIELFPEAKRTAIYKFLLQEVLQGRGSFEGSIEIIRPNDGEHRWLEIKGSVVTDTSGENVCAFGQVTDYTLYRQAQIKLQDTIDTKNKLLGIIGHDLRNPFNALLGFIELLTRSLKEGRIDDAAEYTEILKTAAGQGYDLLVNLLDYSNSCTGKIKMNKVNFDLHTCVNSIIDLSGAMASRKKISLINNIEKRSIVFADQTMITTVLRNLISNAIKFCNVDGIVSINAYATGNNKYIVSVQDTGVMIAHDKILEILHNDTTESTQGTYGEQGSGLGLKLVKDFLARHNSKLEIISEPDYTEFSFEL